ncbi:MAG: preprotein translocase subunit SecA [Candidatus Eisenbacteria bacterium]|uniref:Protein translocase subunit SecA n=1 Tax=Eiseniibacteriota bacterium TaxID=2212470 RepID=A0A7Y2E6T2_UNCEI|nr:preprotein translocase subunit SecA [Candidatus Eisenbacteria bacterium]
MPSIKERTSQLLEKVFGSKYEREMKRLGPIVEEINRLADEYQSLSEDDLKAMTPAFRKEIEEGASLDDLLPRAFAVIKEACRRHVGKSWQVTGHDLKWEMIPYDVQLVGGIILHEGKIAEMATGEGKTLVALMPMYLNALAGSVHLVTVNDYLARRDREWVGALLEYLGLTVGVIQHDMTPVERREAYNADITYGTNNEFGFDYLRDNMAVRSEDQVQQRGHDYCIIDEVDNILIDEARTPLIISGPVTSSNQNYVSMRSSIEKVVRAQERLLSGWLREIEGDLKDAEEVEYDVSVRLLQIQRGIPKHKRLLKILADQPGLQKVIRRVEFAANRDKKMGEIDADLYYTVDEKTREVDLTDKGRALISPQDPEAFVLPDLSVEVDSIDQAEDKTPEEKIEAKEEAFRRYAARGDQIHAISQLLRAYSIYEKDVDYVVQDGKVLIVDEFTGRLMAGRRWSDGLHQAVEAKEGVKVEGENQTLATITIQNYFRLYEKLAGMTGTAETEASEFFEIYGLEVMKIPTHRPIQRLDTNDQVYKTRREKFNAIVDEVARINNSGRPVLVGTVTVEVSETVSRLLKRKGIKHNVLNAKHHSREAEIVRRAGEKGAVTIATNMAGRGTDIKLGPEVLPKDGSGSPLVDSEGMSGLAIIGTERHESRRIDRQLRGRAGRQGDPGSSRFFLSLEDDLMRLFRSERIAGLMQKMGAQEGDVIEHRWVTRGVENAQKKVEQHNFSIRKRLLEYDDVMNKQREVIYGLRSKVLRGDAMRNQMMEYIENAVHDHVQNHVEPPEPLKEDVLRLIAGELEMAFVYPMDVQELIDMGEDGGDPETAIEHFTEKAKNSYLAREADWTEEVTREVERRVMLIVIDEKWRDHLYEMDMLKEGIGLRAYGQKDPLLEYKREAFDTFEALVSDLGEEVLKRFFRISLVREGNQRGAAPALGSEAQPKRPTGQPMKSEHAALSAFAAPQPQATATSAAPQSKEPVRVAERVGRNDPCPCGSGKKYKKCHGNS